MNSPSPFPPNSLVYAYLRYSTGDQNIASQERAVSEWCAVHHLILGKVFRDEAKSGGTTAGRDDFLRLLELLRDSPTPRPAGVVLWSLSRFARDYDDAQYYRADLRRRGYIVFSLSDSIPPGRVGRLVEAVVDYNNEEFRLRSGLEAQRGLRDLAAQGYSIGGFPPRGYRPSAPILLGRKKDGSERLAHKWEFDPEMEERVRLAWRMRLAGEGYMSIHRATYIFKGVNCYASFFNNVTYAGIRKCGSLAVPDSHPAYVTAEEFERVRGMKRPGRAFPRAPEGNPNHPRRRNPESPFLLSGILFCSYCGAAMVGDSHKESRYYRCGKRQREGKTACSQPKIVAWFLHDLVLDWLAENVLTFETLVRGRDEINRRLCGDRSELLKRRGDLRREEKRIDRAASHLVDAVEVSGFTESLRKRLAERQQEQNATKRELAEIESLLALSHVEVSDGALRLLAGEMRGRIQSGEREPVRDIIHGAVVRVSLSQEKAQILYTAPLAGGISGTSLSQIPRHAVHKGGIVKVPPREFESLSWP